MTGKKTNDQLCEKQAANESCRIRSHIRPLPVTVYIGLQKLDRITVGYEKQTDQLPIIRPTVMPWETSELRRQLHDESYRCRAPRVSDPMATELKW